MLEKIISLLNELIEKLINFLNTNAIEIVQLINKELEIKIFTISIIIALAFISNKSSKKV